MTITPTDILGKGTGSDAASSILTGNGLTGNVGNTNLRKQLNSQMKSSTTGATAGPTVHEQAETAATGLVSNALILPILKQLRHSMEEQKGIFSPGTGEKTFGPQFDMEIADRIAQSPRLGIKEALVKKIEKRATQKAASEKQSRPSETVSETKAKRLDVHG